MTQDNKDWLAWIELNIFQTHHFIINFRKIKMWKNPGLQFATAFCLLMSDFRIFEYICQSYRNSMHKMNKKSTLLQKVSLCMKHFWQIFVWKTYHFNCFVYIVQNSLRQRDSKMLVQFIHEKFIQNKAIQRTAISLAIF